MKKINLKFILVCTITAFSLSAFTQNLGKDKALSQLSDSQKKIWGLTEADLSDVLLKDQYQTLHNGLNHYYYTQRYQGIEVYNAILSLHLDPNGRLKHVTSRFVPRLAELVNTAKPALNARQAVQAAVTHLQLNPKYHLTEQMPTDPKKIVYQAPDLSKRPIEVRLVYQAVDTLVRLAWEVLIEPVGGSDYWNMRVDAVDGKVLQKDNWIIHCQFPGTALSSSLHSAPILKTTTAFTPTAPKIFTDGAQYEVFPLPIESPIHGLRSLVTNPADPLASPFGWHDVDGEPGAEYQITRGNNVHAYQDRQEEDESKEDEPDGGEELIFAFPFNDRDSLTKNLPAAVTQLFYTNNMMHDFAWHYGFDEAAGNYQQTNYSGEGKEGDVVIAQAQNGADLNSAFLRNNANFSLSPDGQPSYMQMYIWEPSAGNLLQIEEPAEIAGFYQTATAEFGPALTETPITGEIALALDNSGAPARLCEKVANLEEVAGKIAMVDRGDCFFQEKVLNAEEAGALACIVCNYENFTFLMGAPDNATNPGIPSVMLAYNDCQRIRKLLENGVKVRLQVPEDKGPELLDADFDNGIITHEYAHGISTRLTGGPSTVGCLANEEDMGEGWSDFFALVLTHLDPERNDIARGIGNYVIPLDVNGGGIRRLPYSTNANINDQTYDDIIGADAPHDVGEVWASALWDMYWAFVKVYGWDDDIFAGNGGNNMAIQLVMDGMKLQPCSPGFIDARNAILVADQINNEGANQCLIWEVFARRGLGWSALQKDSDDRDDGLQAFDVRPTCIEALKITKKVTPNILPGDDIEVNLNIVNHKKEALSDILIVDELIGELEFLPASLSQNLNYEIVNNDVQLRLDELAPGDSLQIRYLLSSDPAKVSTRLFLEDAEDFPSPIWNARSLVGEAGWEQSNSDQYRGRRSWYVEGTISENDQVLELTEPILVQGEQPVLRFFHSFTLEAAEDGGFLEISTDGGQKWTVISEDLFFRNPYRGKLEAGTLAKPGLRAFWGSNIEFIGSYIDLSPYAGQEILIRFHFGSDRDPPNTRLVDNGWWIDDIEVFDMINYQTEACIFSSQGDQACSMPGGRGTIVEPVEITDIFTLNTENNGSMRLFPNPSRSLVNVALQNLPKGEASLSIRTLEGKLLYRQLIGVQSNNQQLQLPANEWSRGVYFVHLQTEAGSLTTKLVLQ